MLPTVDYDCLRKAIISTEGVHGVIEMHVAQPYTLTWQKLPKPIVFQFEANMANGYVEVNKGKVSAYFSSIGTKVPANVSTEGPVYLEAILKNIETSCSLENETSNK
ncbi:MAG: hypothetical protein ACN4GM_09560 [Gammaproteobacteria bacterium]